jgi:antitoxin VapB
MSLNIKDAETDKLARALAKEAGESITLAAKKAIEERLARLRAQRGSAEKTDLRAIIHRGRARVTIDSRQSNEILGYDESGLPE